MAEIITADGTVREVQPANGKNFTLKELTPIVGGYIEIIYLNDGRLMIMNEEGKLSRLPDNEVATALARSSISPDDYIVGDVLVCNQHEIK